MAITTRTLGIAGLSSLWRVSINPLNLKCQTLPILSLSNPYSRAFHLSWLGFLVAFLSWFAFPPLIPEAIKKDLKLTPAQIGNSNIVALCATLLVRVLVGPLVDRYGPRLVMAALLILGAIPSGLAGTISSANGLYIIRFFIGILGGTFVPCQAWTTAFFDKNTVGTANALVGGWGNLGGGITFIIMVALYNTLLSTLSPHNAWRVSFAIVPVPVLLFVALLVLVFGTDHPAGKWKDRHQTPAARIAAAVSASRTYGESPNPPKEKDTDKEKDKDKDKDKDKEKQSGSSSDSPYPSITTLSKEVNSGTLTPPLLYVSDLDIAINEPLSLRHSFILLSSGVTWLPALAYATTFGYELAIDANLANVLFGLYPHLGQTKAGYITATYGLLNLFTRPLGGYLGDIIYTRYGVPGKKYTTLLFGFIQGLFSLGLGIYIDSRPDPSLAVIIVLFVLTALFNEAANGLNFSLVPHCNPNVNGMMSGIVGTMGNAGGVFFALIFRLHPLPFGKAFLISGIVAMGINAILVVVRVPRR